MVVCQCRKTTLLKCLQMCMHLLYPPPCLIHAEMQYLVTGWFLWPLEITIASFFGLAHKDHAPSLVNIPISLGRRERGKNQSSKEHMLGFSLFSLTCFLTLLFISEASSLFSRTDNWANSFVQALFLLWILAGVDCHYWGSQRPDFYYTLCVQRLLRQDVGMLWLEHLRDLWKEEGWREERR